MVKSGNCWGVLPSFKDWVESGTRRNATYLHLPAGNYIFKVQASNSQGVWSDKIKELQFTQIKFNNDELATDWGSSNETPDICKIKENTMAGFRVFGVNYEVLRNKLKQTLTANKTYCLQFIIKLKIENKFGINCISVILSEVIQQFKNSQVGLEFGVAVQSHPSIILGLREQWMTISGTFKAKGGENYLYIGFSNKPWWKFWD